VHLLTPEHAERPLPILPNIDGALQAILTETPSPPVPVSNAAIPDLPRPQPTADQFYEPVGTPAAPLTAINLSTQVDPAIPRVNDLPIGFVPVRSDTDYFSQGHEPLSSTLERLRADARSPSQRSNSKKTPYAVAPIPRGVIYPNLRDTAAAQRLSTVGEEHLSPNRLDRPFSLFNEE
jgi:hypothetical protein